jgi:hypothetical protein
MLQLLQQKKDSSEALSSSEQERVQVGEKSVFRVSRRGIHNLCVPSKDGLEWYTGSDGVEGEIWYWCTEGSEYIGKKVSHDRVVVG